MNKLQFKIPKTVNFNIDAALRYWPIFLQIKKSKIKMKIKNLKLYYRIHLTTALKLGQLKKRAGARCLGRPDEACCCRWLFIRHRQSWR